MNIKERLQNEFDAPPGCRMLSREELRELVLRPALLEIERLEAELKETESRRDLAIANYVRTLAERDALTDRLIRAGLKS